MNATTYNPIDSSPPRTPVEESVSLVAVLPSTQGENEDQVIGHGISSGRDDISQTTDGNFYITDLIVEGVAQKFKQKDVESLQLLFLYTWGQNISLERSSQTTWKHSGLVILPLGIGNLTAMVYSGKYILYGQLSEHDLDNLKENAILKHELQMDLISIEDLSLVTLSMSISAAHQAGHGKDEQDNKHEIQSFETTRQMEKIHMHKSKDKHTGPETLLTALCLLSDNYSEKGWLLLRFGLSLWDNFENSSNQKHRDDSILAFKEALRCSSPNEEHLLFLMDFLGYCLQNRFTHTGIISDLSEATSFRKQAVQLTPEDDPALLYSLDNLGNALQDLFELTGGISDLSDAISFTRKAIQLTPDGHSDLPGRLNNLGNALQSLFDLAGDMNNLLEAISFKRQAVQLTPDGHSDLFSMLNNLGNSLQRLFNNTGVITDLVEAISFSRKAVQITPDGHPNLPNQLNSLGSAMQILFKHTGIISDLLEAISFQKQAVQLTPHSHPDLPSRLNNLGNSLQSLFDHAGDMNNLLEAISLKKQAVQLTPDGHSDLSTMLNNLGNSLQGLFNNTGSISDLSEAILFQRKAVELTPDSHPGFYFMLNNLGSALQSLSNNTGVVSGLTEAISLKRQAIQLISDDHPDLPSISNNLGSALQSLFENTGDISHLAEAISFKRQAVKLTPNGHSNLHSRLSNLGSALQSLFEHTGVVSDLMEAIFFLRKAVELTADGHSDLASMLDNLAIALYHLFDLTGAINNLLEAISLTHKVVELTPDSHPDLPFTLNNLGIMVQRLFEHTGLISDLTESISITKRAVQLTPDGHPALPSRLNNLGSSLQVLFNYTGITSDLLEAIFNNRQAIQLTPDGHPNLPGHLNNLATALQSLFKHTGVLNNLSEAISFQRLAVQLTPHGHPTLPSRLQGLGHLLEMQFTQSSQQCDIVSALSFYKEASTSDFGPALQRFLVAKQWARCCKLHDPSHVLDAYTVVINLMSQVAGIEHTIELRHQTLKKVSSITSTAASVALAQLKLELALEWLEQGRCLVWNQLTELRSPMHDLYTEFPDLADQFHKVSLALEKAGSRHTPLLVDHNHRSNQAQKISLADEAHAHIKLAQKRDQFLQQIRSHPQFRDFLRPRRASSFLSCLPSDGPTIIINPDKEKCDVLALIPGNDQPLHISLQSYTSEEGKKMHIQLTKYLTAKGIRMRNADWADRGMRRELGGKGTGIYNILKDLWVNLVKPILDGIGYNTPTPAPGRIWWCVTGPLTFLPIHAAGIYNEDGPRISDFVVSSYIPTVSMLVDKLKDSRAPAASSRLLLVSQAEAPELPRIPNTEKETIVVAGITSKYETDVLCLNGESATTVNVEKEMMSYNSIHLACHGVQDVNNPLKSGFCLGDGRLELSEIIKKQIPQGDLAFLSACQTSKGDEELTEEAVHLAAGMLAAGYRSVVATMWAIKDVHGPVIAEEFYKHMLENGDAKNGPLIDGRKAAYALYHATQCLRKKLGDTEDGLLAWLPYVHYGV